MIYTDKPWNDPKVPQRHQELICDAVAQVADWLNGLNPDLEPEYVYTEGVFLNKDVNEYADSHVLLCREDTRKHGGDLLMQLSIYDGDDGGSSELVIRATRNYHFEETGRTHHGTWEDYKVLEYRDKGPNVVAEEPTVHHYDAPERVFVWDDTYKIDFIQHGFDTYFTPVPLRDSEGQ